jgi:bifunctional DNA-binding transcriptional regulator/antitoxin component of YhaV-PrlF toxin-antitoxin module|tara:strand:- start:212 stop:382 length:171 start_codon:yes stop_codon:yes gene_type:complete
MKQISSIKTIDQYKRIYIPDAMLEEMGVEAGSNVAWMQDETEGHFMLKKCNVEIVD